jgi:hypothetical protein
LQAQAQALAQQMTGAPMAGGRILTAAAAMAQAQARLQAGDPAGAAPAQRAAIAALQQAGQMMARAQAASRAQQAGSTPGGATAGDGTRGPEGAVGGGVFDLKRAGQDDVARRIERSLIKRDARPGLPARAHDYYRRLLGKP